MCEHCGERPRADQPAPSAEQRIADSDDVPEFDEPLGSPTTYADLAVSFRSRSEARIEIKRLTAERDAAWADVVAAQQREATAYRKRGTALALLRAARTDRDAARAELAASQEQEAYWRRMAAQHVIERDSLRRTLGEMTGIHPARIVLAAPATPGQEGAADA